jgi:hypothetical protein
VTVADTIHAMQGGGFYHHQSGWVFPEKIGEFSLVGIPTPFKEGTKSRAIVYFVDGGPWIVRIRSSIPATDQESAPVIEKFVRAQRWDSLQLP